jgi:hypothetical protein
MYRIVMTSMRLETRETCLAFRLLCREYMGRTFLADDAACLTPFEAVIYLGAVRTPLGV